MNLFRLAGELFLMYILYKFIFSFVIPIYNTTRKVKQQFGEMQEKMNQNMNNFNQTSSQPSPAHPSPSKEDYIEYEEIK